MGDKYIGSNLKRLALMNLLYCVMSFGLIIYHRQEVLIWGWIYVIFEILIIVSLAIYEYKLGSKLEEMDKVNN